MYFALKGLKDSNKCFDRVLLGSEVVITIMTALSAKLYWIDLNSKVRDSSMCSDFCHVSSKAQLEKLLITIELVVVPDFV